MQQVGNIARASGKGGAGIAIADFGIQRIQVRLQVRQGTGYPLDIARHDVIVRRLERHAGAAQRRGHHLNGSWLHRRLPAGRFHSGKQRFFNALLQYDGGYRETFHIQRRHQRRRANQPVDPLMERRVGQLTRQNRHFRNRHAAEVVQHHRQTAGLWQGGGQFLHHQADNLRAVLGGDDRGAGFAMDAHAQLCPIGMVARCRFSLLRQMATGEREAQRVDLVCRISGLAQHGSKIVATFGKITGHFMHQDGAGNPARMLVIR